MSVQNHSSQEDLPAPVEPTLEELHAANIASAQALLETIENMKTRQEQWQAIVSEAMAKDREEEMECERAFKRVALHQMQTISGSGASGFEDWLDKKGGNIGSSKVQSWYHDDVLVRATPFCAVLPFPANLSDKGRQEIVDEVASLGLGDAYYVENFPFNEVPLMQCAIALGILGRTSAQGQGEIVQVKNKFAPADADSSASGLDCTAEYLQTPCGDGTDLLGLVASSAVLRLALRSTPCIFLNDSGCAPGSSAALRRMSGWGNTNGAAVGVQYKPSPCALLRCIIIGGDLVAVEGVPSSYNQKSEGKPFDTPSFADAVADFVRTLTAAPSSTLFQRSVQLVVTAHVNPTPDESVEKTADPYSFYLLDVVLFEGSNTDHFQLSELLLLAEYRAALKLKDVGVDATASRLIVRMAGSPWPEISTAIAKDGNAKGAIAPLPTTEIPATPADDVTVSKVDTPPPPATGLSVQAVCALMAVSAAVATAATVAFSVTKRK